MEYVSVDALGKFHKVRSWSMNDAFTYVATPVQVIIKFQSRNLKKKEILFSTTKNLQKMEMTYAFRYLSSFL